MSEQGDRTEGVVEEEIPRGLYKVRLDDGREVTASTTREARRLAVRFLRGDRVLVELSPFDPTRGRIQRRL